jgi:molybdopterin synthase catalytic subunit
VVVKVIYCNLTEKPIIVPELSRHLENRGHGAQILFLGIIRDQNHGRKVQSVAYEAFAPLAKKIFLEICREAQEKWGRSLHAVILHRIGNLGIGDVSVCIGTSLPHRDEAYQASRYLIDQLTQRAPIWKKETYQDGETDWLRGHALCSMK